MTNPTFRALCEELVDKIEGMVPFGPDEEHLTNRAHAALAQPEMHPLADLAATLIADSKQLNPEMAAVLTPEAHWDLYGEVDHP